MTSKSIDSYAIKLPTGDELQLELSRHTIGLGETEKFYTLQLNYRTSMTILGDPHTYKEDAVKAFAERVAEYRAIGHMFLVEHSEIER